MRTGRRTACPPWHRGRARRRSSGSSSCRVPLTNSGQPFLVKTGEESARDGLECLGIGLGARLGIRSEGCGKRVSVAEYATAWVWTHSRDPSLQATGRAEVETLFDLLALSPPALALHSKTAMPTARARSQAAVRLHTLYSLCSLLLLASTSTLASSTSSRSTNLFKRLRGSPIAPGVSPAGDDYWCRVEGECLPCPPGAVSPSHFLRYAHLDLY